MMKVHPTIIKKKMFLQYFLENYELKNIDCEWLLEHLSEKEHYLENIHFVANVSNYPKGIVLSTNCSEKISFLFHKRHLFSTEVDRAFHEIRFHRNEPMFIQINFSESKTNPLYQQILSDDLSIIDKDIYIKQLIKSTKYTLHKSKVIFLKKQIDQALDKGDKKLFIKLTNNLKKMMNNKKE